MNVKRAELCAVYAACRAGSALIRRALEKTLKANGYVTGSLSDRINAAAADGVVTEARRKRARDNIRVLGNDILHNDWRAVTEEEFGDARHCAHRILEDLYDDRPSVEATLIAKNRIPATPPGASSHTPP